MTNVITAIKERILKRVHVRKHEFGLRVDEGEFTKVLGPGVYRVIDPMNRVTVDIASERDVYLQHRQLDVIVKSGALEGRALVLELQDNERAIISVNGRVHSVIGAGLYVLPNTFNKVAAEILTTDAVRFEHANLNNVLAAAGAVAVFDKHQVDEGRVGLLYLNGVFQEVLTPGRYAFFKGVGAVKIQLVDVRERVLDVGGQEIMTEDKVTLRLNAVATYRVCDPRLYADVAEDAVQALYRDAQLALRATVGTRTLDTLLAEKDAVTDELAEALRKRAATLGIEVLSAGIRDIILPGEMKELMNRVTEAKKAAEANLIVRREETAAMRNQANTAKVLENNPTLMRLRELEVLEKIAVHAKLNVVLGEKGLADRVVNLL
ncbi:MAG: slipin family protein [Candidatus Hydrogenedentes bacterium]|nr:slipin family protein [Candidatus Hydrogenedentota bacterium]